MRHCQSDQSSCPKNQTRSEISTYRLGFQRRFSAAGHRGFTLIEVIVVTVMMVILAGVISVRLHDTFDRRVATTCLHVQSILDALAHQLTVTQDRMALVYNADTEQLWLERFAPDRSEISSPGETTKRTDSGSWVRDLLTQPVIFDQDVYIESAMVDTDVRRGTFRFEFDPQQPRPLIRINLKIRDDNDAIILLPGQMQSYRESQSGQNTNIEPEDLDAQGASEEVW